MLCRVMRVHPSGYYAWLKQPVSDRQKENQRLTGQIKQLWLESGCVYGYRKIHDDLRDMGESCGINRVHRLMRDAGIKAQVGYGRRPGSKGGPPSVIAPNQLRRQFDQPGPNQAWVTDITYIRTHEGWLFLAVVIDLFSRMVVGWSMQSRMHVNADVECPENTEIKSPLIADTSRPILGLEAKDDQQGGLFGDGRDVSAGCVQEGHCA